MKCLFCKGVVYVAVIPKDAGIRASLVTADEYVQQWAKELTDQHECVAKTVCFCDEGATLEQRNTDKFAGDMPYPNNINPIPF